MNVNIDLQNILQELTANLRKQDLQSLNKPDESAEDESQESEEENVEILTPEMEQANGFYHQGMKLINGTNNRQYST